jgi:hypothetical protein
LQIESAPTNSGGQVCNNIQNIFPKLLQLHPIKQNSFIRSDAIVETGFAVITHIPFIRFSNQKDVRFHFFNFTLQQTFSLFFFYWFSKYKTNEESLKCTNAMQKRNFLKLIYKKKSW